MTENNTLPSFFEQCHPAGFWVRTFSIILDILLFVLVFLMFEVADRSFVDVPEILLLKFLWILLYVIYTIYFISSKWQATLGQRIMCIYVGDENLQKIHFLTSCKRFVFLFLSYFIGGISLLMIVLNKENLTPHDYLCKTRVFYGKK
ncbi:MAG: putative RDD family membrane protein YckC [Myxococcota bacterium]|jgi:uncharacterized RDD family membrane protein YckC